MNLFLLIVVIAAIVMYFVTHNPGVFFAALTIVMVVGLIDYKRQAQEEDAARAGQNMLQYVESYERELSESTGLRHPGLPVSVGYTVTEVNLRASPSSSSAVVAVLAMDDMVVIENHLGQGGWFRVSTTEARGWVYGRYLRPELSGERLQSGRAGFGLAFRFMFPESSFWKKVLGWFIGVLIAIAAHGIARENSGAAKLVIGVPFLYFLIKNRMTMGHAPFEVFVFFWSVVFLTAFNQLLVAWLIKQGEN